MNVSLRRWTDSKGRAHRAFVMDYTDPATGRRRQRVVPGDPAGISEARDLATTLHRTTTRAHHYGHPSAPADLSGASVPRRWKRSC